MSRARTVVHSVLVASTIAMAAIGCSAAPGSEGAGGADEAVTVTYQHLPEARCTLIAGNALAANHTVAIRVGGGSTDASTAPYRTAIAAAGGSGSYTLTYSAAGTSWFAIDVTHAVASQVTSASIAYGNVSPVYSGYFSCDYNWADFEIPPGGTRPYVPHLIAAYDPRGCGSSCAPPIGTGI